jgi:hypothetical protein
VNPTKESPQSSAEYASGKRHPAWRNILLLLPVALMVMVGIGAYMFLAHPGQSQSQTLTVPTATGPELKLIPVSALSDKVRAAPDVVRDAYRFAAANPDILSKIPCYCGCGAEGHQSNLACYVKQVNADGSVVFDDHALNCGICVDIARDTMLLIQEGKTLKQIRTYIDAQYSKFGQPTQTEPVL